MEIPSAPELSRQTAAARGRGFRELLTEATPRFYVTPALLALNVGWFLVMVLSGVSAVSPETPELLRFGANFGPLTLDGEWWRTLSSTFVHIGLLHLFFNMWALWNLGVFAERMFGNGTYLLIYVASGLGGSLASVAWNPYVTSAGASGALLGVASALAAFLYLGHVAMPARFVRRLRTTLVFLIALTLLFGAVVPGIDNAGHIGGLLVGLVLGAALHRPLPVAARAPRRFLILPVVAVALLATAAIAHERARNDALLFLADADRLFTAGENAEALSRLDEAVRLGSDSALLRSEAGLLYLVHERYDEAIENLYAAAALEPERAEHYNRLALALARRGSGEEALAAIERALELSPDAPHLIDSLGTVRYYRDELDDAVDAYRQAVDLKPSDGRYRFNLAVALLKRGDTEEAAAALAAARRLAPELESVSDEEPLL